MERTCSPAMAFVSDGCYPPQATISLSQTSLMTPEPLSPESYYSIKEEHMEGEESKKPTKKRKSWGQELPTPKTNLPPRKRAKTEDEKEQRRIERVLRNRQAAQSSRERKRQEVEKLEGEKMSIEEQNESLKERLMTVEHEKFLLAQQVAKMAAQMEAVRSGSLAPKEISPPPESDLIHHENLIKQEILEEYPFALPTPQTSFGAPSTTFPSPTTATYSGYSTPATISLGFDALIATPDMTQHPAVSVRGGISSADSAYDSPTSCDPIIFDDSSLSDVNLDSLFGGDVSVKDDLHFFEDGFGSSPLDDNEHATGFGFDSLVDLDACQPSTSNKEGKHSDRQEDLAHYNELYPNDYSFSDFKSSPQTAATSSAQQPLLGAP